MHIPFSWPVGLALNDMLICAPSLSLSLPLTPREAVGNPHTATHRQRHGQLHLPATGPRGLNNPAAPPPENHCCPVQLRSDCLYEYVVVVGPVSAPARRFTAPSIPSPTLPCTIIPRPITPLIHLASRLARCTSKTFPLNSLIVLSNALVCLHSRLGRHAAR